MIDSETFVKSILAAMWMLNDLPRANRRDLESQLGIIWLLMSDPKCFPTLHFTAEQQQAICQALEACHSPSPEPFRYTFDVLQQLGDNVKVKKEN